MNKERGYVWLWRSIDQNELLDNDNTAFLVFIKLMTRVDRNTGTLVTGRKKLAAACNLNPNTLYSALKRLEASTIIQQRSNSTSTAITICKWKEYQQQGDTWAAQQQRADNTIQKRERKRDLVTNVTTSSSDELDTAHAWVCVLFGKDPARYKLTTQRKQKLRLRLKELGKDRFKQAYEAVAASQFHRGDNDRGWKIDDDPYWLLSSAERAETWANKYEQVGKYRGKLTEMEIA